MNFRSWTRIGIPPVRSQGLLTAADRANWSIQTWSMRARRSASIAGQGAITLIESTRAVIGSEQQVLTALLPKTGSTNPASGIGGVPGAGQIPHLHRGVGVWLIEQGKKLAVLAIDLVVGHRRFHLGDKTHAGTAQPAE